MKDTINPIVRSLTLFSLILFQHATSAANKPVLLSNLNNTGIERFRIDPSNQYVVFNEFDSNGVLNRFSRKIDGQSPPIQIASDLSRSEDTFLIDADDLRVFYRDDDQRGFISTQINSPSNPVFYSVFNSDLQIFERRGSSLSVSSNTDLFFFFTSNGQLYSSPTDGNGPLINYTETLNTVSDGLFRRTTDRQGIFFSTEIDDTFRHQLFFTNVDGSSNPTFITELPEDTDIDTFPRVNSDDTRVVYITETFLDNRVEILQLFSAPLDGSSAPIALSEPLTATNADIDFFISGDNSSVIFITENFDNNEESIFIASIDGSFNTRLIDSGESIHQFLETSNSQSLVYKITEDSGASFIKSIPIDAIEPTQPITISGTASRFNNFVLGPNENDVFYVGGNQSHIFKTSIDGNSPSVNINSESVDSSSELVIVDDTLFFISSFDNLLFSSSIDGQEINLLSSPLNENGNFLSVTDFEISDEGRFAVYTTNDLNGGTNIFSVRLNEEEQPLCFPIKTQNGNVVTICL